MTNHDRWNVDIINGAKRFAKTFKTEEEAISYATQIHNDLFGNLVEVLHD